MVAVFSMLKPEPVVTLYHVTILSQLRWQFQPLT